MILPQVRQAFGSQSPEQLEEIPRGDFVGGGARKSIRRRKYRGNHAVAPRKQAAAFYVRLAARVRQDFFQDFRANSDGIGHALECTSGRMAGSGWMQQFG
jgi:hypothetical protein